MSDAKAKRRILIVEDEPDLVAGLSDALSFEGFSVQAALEGAVGLRKARQQPPDCVILDLMLPDRNGFAVCTDLRQMLPKVPILILSARSQEVDIVRGLECGADDYVTKPFGIAELIARVHALFRRVDRHQAVGDASVIIGQAEVDLRGQMVKVGRRQEPLTFHEAECLRLLLEKAGEVVSREELLEKVWGADGLCTTRTVDNVMVKLRRKLHDDAKTPRHILTVYGTGYKLVR